MIGEDVFIIVKEWNNHVEILQIHEKYTEAVEAIEKLQNKMSSDKASFIATSSTNKTKWFLIQCPLVKSFKGKDL